MRNEHPLITYFLVGLSADLHSRVTKLSHLEGVLGDIMETAQAAWPMIHLSAESFLPYVATRLPKEIDPERSLLEMKVADLYLACACIQKIPSAIAAFETQLFPTIEAALRRRNPTGQIEDIKQQLCQKLLIGDEDHPPKMALYAGRGDLRSWVSVTAVREAIDLLRKGQREQPLQDEDLVDLTSSGEDQELQYLKRLYRQEFKAAFLEALSEIPRRERNLLRHHLLDGLNIDQIGALYNVHRATIARWIAKARSTLLENTRKSLMTRLRVDKQEFESIMRLIQSHFDVSIHHFLKKHDD